MSVISEEAFEDVRIVIAKLFCNGAHFQVRVAGEKILSEVEPRFNLIVPHAFVEELVKGTLERSYCHSEFGSDPVHSKLYMSVIAAEQVMRKTRRPSEFLGEFTL